MILHVPWTDESELRNEGENWAAAYERSLGDSNLPDLGGQENLPQGEDSEPEDEEVEPERVQAEWMHVAQQLPNQPVISVEVGNREFDAQYPWDENAERYGEVAEIVRFLDTHKQGAETERRVYETPVVQFTEEQQQIFEYLQKQIDSVNDPNVIVSRLVIIQGKAGSGKSTVLRKMTSMLCGAFGEESFKVMAPTGAAAINVEGSTLHSGLKIYGNLTNLSELTGENERNLQLEFENVKFLFIDEYSMVGCRLLNAVHQRCMQSKGVYDSPFGNLFVYLIGDIRQLPPVLDSPVYQDRRQLKSNAAVEGNVLFDSFKKSFALTVSQRQNADEQLFRDLLDRLAQGECTDADHQLLMTRAASQVPDFELDWEDVLRLYPTREAVAEYNLLKVIKNGRPVAKISAKHNNQTAINGSADAAQGLEPVLHLSIGSRVMLRTNLWTAEGLVNGALGTVKDILYETGKRPPNAMPVAIMVEFDKYTGPCLNGTSVFPVTALTRAFTEKNVSCSRTQFPLVLAWAITIHKSQGITLDRAVVDIGPKEMQIGLTYVAFTRVKTLNGLVLKPGFDYTRLKRMGGDALTKRRLMEQKILAMSGPNVQ